MQSIKGFTLFCIALASVTAIAIPKPKSTDDDELKPFELFESIQSSSAGNFPLYGFSGTWISGTEYMQRISNRYEKRNVVTSEVSDVIDVSIFTDITVSSIALSPTGKYVLAQSSRNNNQIACRVYNFETEEIHRINNEDGVQFCRWLNPVQAEDILLYALKNNLYWWQDRGLDQKVTRITDEDIPDIVINGRSLDGSRITDNDVPELEVTDGTVSDGSFYSSPDGQRFAYRSYNNAKVEKFHFHRYGVPGSLENQYPEIVQLRYAKVAKPNPKYTITVVDIDTLSKFIIPVPVNKVTDDYLLTEISWIANDILTVGFFNRRQNILSVQMCDCKSQVCLEAVGLSNPTGWIDYPRFTCYAEVEKCFYVRDIDNWRHIFQFDATTVSTQVTTGEKTIERFLGYDPKSDHLYYTAYTKENIAQRHVFQNDRCVSCEVQTPEGNLCTYASASMSRDSSHFSLTCTGPDPSFTNFYSGETLLIVSELEGNTVTRDKLKEYQTMKTEYLRVDVEGGFSAAVKIVYPSDIDLETSTEKLPMIVYVYGGPNSFYVFNSYSVGFQNYLVTNRRVIYTQIDGRGTINKGMDMYFSINNQLGSVEMQDQISVTKYLQGRYNCIDESRTGIWGWSYGGYSTSMILAQDKENVFKAGIAVAPVTSWLYYNTGYTERYMGWPTENDNLKGYIDSDVTLRAKDIKGHSYLLIHGNADDNVHFQHAMQLARNLQKEEVLFEQMSYPDEDHNLGGVTQHLYLTMMHFWERHLIN